MDRMEYKNMIFTEGHQELQEYRKKNSPKKLYKYFPLQDIMLSKKTCNYLKEENDKKLNSLKNNQFWLSTRKALNDPYELKAMFYTKEYLEENNIDFDYTTTMDKLFNGTLIGCFTTKLDNMPMWAHYGNNHQGFVVEYDVINPKLIYPICYSDERMNMDEDLVEMAKLDVERIMSREVFLKDREKMKVFNDLVDRARHNCIFKRKEWMYEDEYRILWHKKIANKIECFQTENGALLPNEELGLKAKSVYLGMKCSKEYEVELIDITKSLDIDIFKMDINNDSEMYIGKVNLKVKEKEVEIV